MAAECTNKSERRISPSQQLYSKSVKPSTITEGRHPTVNEKGQTVIEATITEQDYREVLQLQGNCLRQALPPVILPHPVSL